MGGTIVSLTAANREFIEQGTRILVVFLALIQPFQATQFILSWPASCASRDAPKTTAVVIFVDDADSAPAVGDADGIRAALGSVWHLDRAGCGSAAAHAFDLDTLAKVDMAADEAEGRSGINWEKRRRKHMDKIQMAKGKLARGPLPASVSILNITDRSLTFIRR